MLFMLITSEWINLMTRQNNNEQQLFLFPFFFSLKKFSIIRDLSSKSSKQKSGYQKSNIRPFSKFVPVCKSPLLLKIFHSNFTKVWLLLLFLGQFFFQQQQQKSRGLKIFSCFPNTNNNISFFNDIRRYCLFEAIEHRQTIHTQTTRQQRPIHQTSIRVCSGTISLLKLSLSHSIVVYVIFH